MEQFDYWNRTFTDQNGTVWNVERNKLENVTKPEEEVGTEQCGKCDATRTGT
jgi:hypothetical protein